MKKYEKIGKTKTISENEWWKYQKELFLLPNGKLGEYNYVETISKHSVIIIPKYKDKFLMIRQYRYLFDDYFIEFPGGFVDLSIDDPIDYGENANNELRQETGFSASCITQIGELMPYKGISNEIAYIYELCNLEYNPLPKEDTEIIELLIFDNSQINKLIKTNIIKDSFTIAAWKLYESLA